MKCLVYSIVLQVKTTLQGSYCLKMKEILDKLVQEVAAARPVDGELTAKFELRYRQTSLLLRRLQRHLQFH